MHSLPLFNELFKEEGMAILVEYLAELFLVNYSENTHVDRAENVLTEVLVELDAKIYSTTKEYW